jgi:predicted RNase H-like nuclease
MEFYSLACNCGCPDPMMKKDSEGTHYIVVFPNETTAQLAASARTFKDGRHPLVKKFKLKMS